MLEVLLGQVQRELLLVLVLFSMARHSSDSWLSWLAFGVHKNEQVRRSSVLDRYHRCHTGVFVGASPAGTPAI